MSETGSGTEEGAALGNATERLAWVEYAGSEPVQLAAVDKQRERVKRTSGRVVEGCWRAETARAAIKVSLGRGQLVCTSKARHA